MSKHVCRLIDELSSAYTLKAAHIMEKTHIKGHIHIIAHVWTRESAVCHIHIIKGHPHIKGHTHINAKIDGLVDGLCVAYSGICAY